MSQTAAHWSSVCAPTRRRTHTRQASQSSHHRLQFVLVCLRTSEEHGLVERGKAGPCRGGCNRSYNRQGWNTQGFWPWEKKEEKGSQRHGDCSCHWESLSLKRQWQSEVSRTLRRETSLLSPPATLSGGLIAFL